MDLEVQVFSGGIHHLTLNEMQLIRVVECINFWNNENNKYSVIRNIEYRHGLKNNGWCSHFTVMWI